MSDDRDFLELAPDEPVRRYLLRKGFSQKETHMIYHLAILSLMKVTQNPSTAEIQASMQEEIDQIP